MKLFFTILSWTLIIAYLVIGLGFTEDSRKGILCTDVRIILEDSLKGRFYSQGDIGRIIESGNIKALGYPLTGINTREMEALFHSKAYISKVDIFTTMNGLLVVRVKQREPVLRIITNDGMSCFLDKDGYVLPDNRKFAQYVMVAGGRFSRFNEVIKAGSLGKLEEKEKYNEWFDVLQLTQTLNKDELWRNQVVQIYYNRQGHFELYPRVGGHQIILGNIESLDEKLENLKILYKKGLAYEGWNNYEKIDLRYKNQVVCTKR